MIFKNIFQEQKTLYSIIASLFFNVGFFTSINSVLVSYFKIHFHFSYFVANFIPVSFFLAYFLMSVPFGKLSYHWGYKSSLQISLILVIVGCGGFIVSISMNNYILLLISLFLIASFVTGIEVTANPMVESMGPKKSSFQRLTLVHFLDSLGTIVGPLFAAYIFFYSIDANEVINKTVGFYLILTFSFIIYLIWVVKRVPRKFIIPRNAVATQNITQSLYKHKPLMFGIAAIFIYVGCEVSAANFLISFALQNTDLTAKKAAFWVSLYWAGQMIGRLISTAFFGKINAKMALTCCGVLAVTTLLLALTNKGMPSLYFLTLLGLANSIMYPGIFSLAVANLRDLKSQASGLLHMGVIGGALIPLAQGFLADQMGIIASYWLLAVLYSYIIYYALRE